MNLAVEYGHITATKAPAIYSETDKEKPLKHITKYDYDI